MPSKTKTALAALFILGPVAVVVLAGPNNGIDDHGSARAVSVPMSIGRTGVVNYAAKSVGSEQLFFIRSVIGIALALSGGRAHGRVHMLTSLKAARITTGDPAD